MTLSAIDAMLALMLLLCWLSCADRVLKRLARDCALVSNSWREASSVGLAAASCMVLKKLCSAAVMPVSLLDRAVSSGVIWFRYEEASLLSEVVVRSWFSRNALYTRRTSASVVPLPMKTWPTCCPPLVFCTFCWRE
ncbi:hypothetical protein D3C77_500380 [compost metagenome]